MSAFSRRVLGAANRRWMMVPEVTGSSSMVWSTFMGPFFAAEARFGTEPTPTIGIPTNAMMRLSSGT